MSITRYSNWEAPRGHVNAASLAETSTIEGFRHNAWNFDTYTAGQVKYFLFRVPDAADWTLVLQQRVFKSINGATKLRILWNVESFVLGSALTKFNQYNEYDIDSAELEVYNVSSIVEGSGIIIREEDEIPSSGVGSHTSGNIAADSGFRQYKPGTYFIAEVTNSHSSDNHILLSYDWAEVPSSIIRLGHAE